MKYGKTIIVGSLLLLTSFSSVGHIMEGTDPVIYRQYIPDMITAANGSAENDRAVADALCVDMDLSAFSYEQLHDLWQPKAKSELVSKLLADAVAQKEIEIYNNLRNMTAEECAAYIEAFPSRKEIVERFLSNTLLANIKELSLFELLYCDDWLPQDYHSVIASEIGRRNDEVRQVLSNKKVDYNTQESKLSQYLKYSIEYTLWTYFVEGHKQLNKAYSQISMVPDDAYAASSQYQRLVAACFPAKQIRESVQKQVNQFCSALNDARKEYSAAMGSDTYQKLTYTVPAFKVNTNVSIAPLYKISESREEFVKSRENISTGTSVLGWLFGPVTGLVAKGIGDWLAIDDLVESEYTAREKYMESVQKSLIADFATYSRTVVKGIDQALRK